MFKNVKNEGLLKGFYTQKTLQPSNRFIVEFFDELDANGVKKNLYDKIGYMPNIKPWHITSVDIPVSNSIETEEMIFGYQIPKVDLLKQAKTISVGFEEDEIQTIHRFVIWLNRKIISPDGFHRSQTEARISGMNIYVLDNFYVIRRQFLAENLFLSKESNTLKLEYGSENAVTYDLEFSCANIKIINNNVGVHIFDVVKNTTI